MKKTTCLKDLTDQILEYRNERDWKQFHNNKDLAINLQQEASEVLEHFLWKNGEEMEKYCKDHRDEIAEELCDVLYSTLLLASDMDIDLADAFQQKMQKNAAKYPVEKAKGSADKYTAYE